MQKYTRNHLRKIQLGNAPHSMSQSLFENFQATTKAQWQQQAMKDLKGKDFDATLLWASPEKITIQPYYAAEDIASLPIDAIQQAQLSNTHRWQNRVTVEYTGEKSTNVLIIKHLSKGANEILLDLSQVDIKDIHLAKLLDKIKLSETPIIFRVQGQSSLLAAELLKIIPYKLKGGVEDDVLARWMTTGVLEKDSWKNAGNCFRLLQNSEKFHTLSVQSHHFHRAGANAVQELAFTLASAVTYLDKLTDEGITIEELLPKIEISLSIGTNYFMEIAKVRALRYLWSLISEQWTKNTISQEVKINCQTSTFYDAAITPNTNMLRATTEAMAAVIGGCDSLSVHRYDAVFASDLSEEDLDFSERIARNISILLKEEAHLDKTNDPSAGSFYVETLTDELAKAAWQLFLEVEKMGGIIPAFEAGFVQNEIEKTFESRVNALQNGKVMVGVNKFRHDEKNSHLTTNQVQSYASQLPLLKNRRLSEVFEQ